MGGCLFFCFNFFSLLGLLLAIGSEEFGCKVICLMEDALSFHVLVFSYVSCFFFFVDNSNWVVFIFSL